MATPSVPDRELPHPPNDSVAAIAISSDEVLAASWDTFVHHYRVDFAGSSADRVQTFQHEAPVLDVCFINPKLAASACLDRRVRLIDLQSGQMCILGSHVDAVSKICWCPQTQMLITGSWDRSLKLWTVSQPQRQGTLLKTIELPDKVLALAVSPAFGTADISKPVMVQSASAPGKPVPVDTTPRLVVGMVGRRVHVYDLLPLRSASDRESAGEAVNAREFEPDQKRESSLKYMIRHLQCMPAGDGYATSSIEGRIAVEFFDPSSASQQKKYAFKCHRQPAADANENCDTVYPVNAVAFHPVHGTFASLGGDAVVSIWDAAAKKRVKQYTRLDAPITAGAIDPTGHALVIATGGPSAEYTETEPDSQPPTQQSHQHAHSTKLIIKSNIWTDCKPKLRS